MGKRGRGGIPRVNTTYKKILPTKSKEGYKQERVSSRVFSLRIVKNDQDKKRQDLRQERKRERKREKGRYEG